MLKNCQSDGIIRVVLKIDTAVFCGVRFNTLEGSWGETRVRSWKKLKNFFFKLSQKLLRILLKVLTQKLIINKFIEKLVTSVSFVELHDSWAVYSFPYSWGFELQYKKTEKKTLFTPLPSHFPPSETFSMFTRNNFTVKN